MLNDDFKILGGKKIKEMDLPPVLYKYRDWTDENHKRVLTHNELFLASPASFKDEFDCKVPIRYDLLTDKEIYDKYFKLSKFENPNFNRQQHRKSARDWQKKGLMRDKQRLEELDKEFFDKFNKLYGVLSLTAIYNNIDMWNYYSDNGKGFCVGFNTIPLLNLSKYFGDGGNVSYYDTLPIIKEIDPPEKKHFLQIYSKLRKWEFEKEYRLTKFNIENRQVVIPSEFFSQIIIGDKMSDDFKTEIITLSKNKFENALISIATIENKKVTINPL